MKVLALVSDGFGGHGGISVYNQELLNALAAHQQISAVRILPRSGDGPSGHAKLIQESAVPHPLHYSALATVRAMRESFDWVFCGHLHHLPLARIVAVLCGARVWLQLHGIEAWQPPGAMLRTAAARSDLVTVVSRYTRERFLSWCDVEPVRVKVLSNTFSPQFTPGDAHEPWRAQFAPNGEPIILTVSRLQSTERYKGHEQVMRAMCEAPLRINPAPVYVIAGQGDDVDWLRARAAALGLVDRVHFIGVVNETQLRALYRTADVFAMPSSGEGFGIVFLEALACGVPVIAGNSDGARDALRDGVLGDLVDVHDPFDIAQAIRRALSRTPVDTPTTTTKDLERDAEFRMAAGGVEVFSRANFAAQLDCVLRSVPAR